MKIQNNNYDDIKTILEAFADDIESVEIIKDSGEATFTRLKKDYVIKFRRSKNQQLFVEFDNKEMEFNDFLLNELAQMKDWAEKIVQKRKPSKSILFVDSQATKTGEQAKPNTKALDVLSRECDNDNPFSTKITFITADAGHGKTSLLKQFQYIKAKEFLEGKCNYIFWHIDLQGRQLARLDEAIMADLANLRISGLFMASIYTLLQMNALIIAIDGFDELSAEQGEGGSIGALSYLVQQLNGKGVIMAAARRTFFNVDGYVKKIKIGGTFSIEEIKLENWTRAENESYMQQYIKTRPNSSSIKLTFEEIFNSIGRKPEHPFLTTPFLFVKLVEILVENNQKPSDFFIGSIDNFEGNSNYEAIEKMLNAFIKREVGDKWRSRSSNGDEPYLTTQQHITLLSYIASEMWDVQKEHLTIENIRLITKLAMDEWRMSEDDRQRQIISMIEMHALLIPGENQNSRKFEHPEFKNYFLANYLLIQLNGSNNIRLKKILSQATLPDSVAMYLSNKLTAAAKIQTLKKLEALLADEVIPTFLQGNIGTIIPFIASNLQNDEIISFGNSLTSCPKVTYTSISFENKKIQNFEIFNGLFSITLKNSELKNFKVIRSEFLELTIYNTTNKFHQIEFIDTKVQSIALCNSPQNEIERTFVPQQIKDKLGELGIKIEFTSTTPTTNILPQFQPSKLQKLANRFLHLFSKNSIISEYAIYDDTNPNSKFSPKDASYIKDEIIPLLEEFSILEESSTKIAQSKNSKAWRINYSLSDILEAERDFVEGKNETILSKFWNRVSN